MSELIAFIPARGGSKAIPRKNLVPLAGRPLIDFSIDAANDTGEFSRVIVSTDDRGIAAHSRSKGCEIHERPSKLATDTSRVVDSIIHASSVMAFSADTVIVVLQPTSPLRSSSHIITAIRMHQERKLPVVSVVECEHHPFKTVTIDRGQIRAMFSHHSLEASRQDLPRAFRPNGAIYVALFDSIMTYRSLVPSNALAYEMTYNTSVDVDNYDDLALAERLLTQSI